MSKNKAGKLLVREIVAKFPKIKGKQDSSCIQDMICPECGWRDSFEIKGKTSDTMTDEGREESEDNFEYDDDSYCQCGRVQTNVGDKIVEHNCIKDGTVADFTCPGLDEYLAALNHKPSELDHHLRQALSPAGLPEFNQYDDGEHRGNGDRAGRADHILSHYKRMELREHGTVDVDTWSDLFADLLHLAHRDKVNVAAAFLTAINHWREESQ